MKLLISVLSCISKPYDALMRGQMETWDSIDVPGTETVYYVGGPIQTAARSGKILTLPCEDDNMPWKMKLMLDYVWDQDWDMIFRTNASSYVDKAMTLRKALQLPESQCYCGMFGHIFHPQEPADLDFASGSGLFISRDAADILRKELRQSNPKAWIEDVWIGEILKQFPRWVGDRQDFFSLKRLRDTYHYRCKPYEKRDVNHPQDLDAFRAVHKFKTEKT